MHWGTQCRVRLVTAVETFGVGNGEGSGLDGGGVGNGDDVGGITGLAVVAKIVELENF